MAVVSFHNDLNESVTSEQVLAYVNEHIATLQGLSCKQVLTDRDVAHLETIFNRHYAQSVLTVLRLPKNKLSGASYESVARIISCTPTLRELDLSENPVDSVALESLTQILQMQCCGIKYLNLCHNKIGAKGAPQLLASVLRHNQSLEHLRLGYNSLGTKGVKVIAESLRRNTVLRILDLSHNKITDKGVGLMGSILEPELSDSVLSDLDLTFNKITYRGSEHLVSSLIKGNNTHLRKLNMSLNQLGSEGAEYFGVLLRFSHSLEELNLSRNNIGDGVDAIVTNLLQNRDCNLKRLDLSWNSVTDYGAHRLADFLRQNSCLEYLNLDSNAIGDDGISYIANGLHADLALRELSLVGNQMSDTKPLVNLICQIAPRFVKIHYEMNNMTEEAEEQIKDALAYRSNLASWLGRLAKKIGRRKLINIDLLGYMHSDVDLQKLSENLAKYRPRLNTAMFGGPRVSERGVAYFCENTLSLNLNMKRFSIESSVIGRAGVIALASGIQNNTHLKYLHLVDCHILTDEARLLACALQNARCPLERINLMRNSVGDLGAQGIFRAVVHAVHPTLRALNLSHNGISDVGLQAISSFNLLEEMSLNGNKITDRGALDLAKACIGGTNLRWLHLASNRLSQKGIQTLSLFLPFPHVLSVEDQVPNGVG